MTNNTGAAKAHISFPDNQQLKHRNSKNFIYWMNNFISKCFHLKNQHEDTENSRH